MAVGDVVNGISAPNTILDFQPAAGVECIITWCGGPAVNGFDAILFNGAVSSSSGVVFGTSGNNSRNQKLFITNSIYLRLIASGAATQTAYSGLQIK